MSYQVQVSEVTPQLLAAARGQGNAQNYLPRLFELLDEVWVFLKTNPQVKHEGLNVFLYFDGGKKEMPIEAGVKITAPFESTGKVVCSTIPGGTVATVTHIGPYEKLSEAHSALLNWCKDNNRPCTGTTWEVYGHWNDDPEKLRTDVFYLLG
jgi:effector-binding domain-containing protein